MKIEIQFPIVRKFSDYHAITEYARILSDVTGVKIRGIEEVFSQSTGVYIGSFYPQNSRDENELARLIGEIIPGFSFNPERHIVV